MKLQYKVATASATAALVLNLMAPAAFADTTVSIQDNGRKSDNTVNLTDTNTTSVNQVNNLTVGVNVTAKANTGGNKASDNTGGDVSIKTGNADATANLTVTGGVNAASVENCGCDEDTTVKVNNNGKKSKNKANVTTTNSTGANQVSNATVGGSIKAKAKTGKNKASDATAGNVDITTKDATSNSTVDVTGPVNVLNP